MGVVVRRPVIGGVYALMPVRPDGSPREEQ